MTAAAALALAAAAWLPAPPPDAPASLPPEPRPGPSSTVGLPNYDDSVFSIGVPVGGGPSRAEETLRQRTSLLGTRSGETLRDVLDRLAGIHQIPIVADRAALERQGLALTDIVLESPRRGRA